MLPQLGKPLLELGSQYAKSFLEVLHPGVQIRDGRSGAQGLPPVVCRRWPWRRHLYGSFVGSLTESDFSTASKTVCKDFWAAFRASHNDTNSSCSSSATSCR